MRWAAFLLVLLLPGCVSPAEVTAALEAPLPPAGTPFVVLVTTCASSLPSGPSALAVYPNGVMHHVRLEAATEGVQLNADTRAPHTETERVVLDIASTGALDLDALTDDKGRYLVIHAEKHDIELAEMRDLQRRVTLAGFPVLGASYGDDPEACIDDYAAWIEGGFVHVQDVGGAAPWALHHVRDLLREHHA